jgi:hypothetical protein
MHQERCSKKDAARKMQQKRCSKKDAARIYSKNLMQENTTRRCSK